MDTETTKKAGTMFSAEGFSRFEDRLAYAGRVYEGQNDKVLLDWMNSGDEKAFEEIFSRYSERIVAYANRYIASLDLAKDVSQEVFIKLLNRPPGALLNDNLSPWLFKVTRNLAIDKRRHRKFEVSGEETLPEPKEEVTPLKHVTADSDAEMVRSLVNGLSPEMRDVVTLHIFDGMAFKDIAAVLNIPQGTALWRMHRAMELLRLEWNKQGMNH